MEGHRGAEASCATPQLGQGKFLLPWSKYPDAMQGASGRDVKRLRHLSGCPQAPFCPALLSKLGFISSWKEGKWRGRRPKQESGDREIRTMEGSERFLMQSTEGDAAWDYACKTQVFVFVNSRPTVLLQKKKHTGNQKKPQP